MDLLTCFGLLSALVPQGDWTRKINVPPRPVPASRIGEAVFSPDETRVVFSADLDHDGDWSVYAVPVDGSLEAVRLDGEGSRSITDGPPFAVTGDSSRVVWIGDGRAAGVHELFSAPIDGSEPSECLHAPLAGDLDVVRFAPSPDGSRVAFVIEGPTEYYLLANAVGGGQPVEVLDTFPKLAPVGGLAVEASSSRVVFAAGRLYSAPLDGSSGAVILSDPPALAVVGFELTPDGRRALYRQRMGIGGAEYLFSVPVDGSAGPVQIEPRSLEFTTLLFSADSARVVFQANSSTFDERLVNAPCDGSSPGIDLVVAGDIRERVVLTSDGTSLVYQESNAIYRRALDGSDVPVRLDGPGASVVSWFEAGADELVYVNPNERLFGASYDGSGGRLLEPGPANELDDLLIQSRGGVVAFARHGVWSVPALDPGGLALLDGRDEVFDLLQTSPGASGSVLYLRDPPGSEVQELWAVRLDGSKPAVQLSPPITGTRLTGDVVAYEVAWPYVAYEERNERFPYSSRLLVARLDRTDVAVERVPLGVLVRSGESFIDTSWWIGGSNLVFVGQLPGDSSTRLCRVPMDGSLPMESISGSHTLRDPTRVLPTGPSGARFLFEDATQKWCSVPADGSAAPVVLSSEYGRHVYVREDGDSAVFLRGSEAWLKVLDGGPPTQIIPGHASNEFWGLLGDYFSYRSDLDSDGLLDLRMVQLASGVDRFYDESFFYYDSKLSGDRLSYVASRSGGNPELYSVPLDASAAPIRLNGALVPNGRVDSFIVRPDDATLIYLADQDVDNAGELYRVPADGSQTPTRLITSLPAGTSTQSFKLSPDQESLAVMLETPYTMHSLHGLPVDGGSLVELGLPRVPGGRPLQGGFVFEPESNALVFAMDREVVGRFELYRQPLDARTPPERLSIPLVESGDVQYGGVTTLPQGILYLADAEADDVVELYFVQPIRGPRGSQQTGSAPTRTVTRTR